MGPSTRAVHAGQDIDLTGVRSHVVPIYQTVNFNYTDAEEGLAIFTGRKPGYIYSRDSNPTIDAVNLIVANLENAEAAESFGSGMAAISTVFMMLTEPGQRVVASESIYGGTIDFLRRNLVPMGREVVFVDITDLEAVRQVVTPETSVLYAEPLSNPTLAVADIPALADIAHSVDARLVVDNTFTPPPIFQPLKWGADVVVHSATKYLGGHGDLTAGIVLGRGSFIEEMHPTVKNLGNILHPFTAWLLIRGIRTLGVRVERHCSNAMAIAHFLDEHPKVERVYYPGLESHPQHVLAERLFNGFGGMLSFEVKGGFAAGRAVMSAVRVCSFTVSLGEVDTLIIHPASTSHVSLSPEERARIGISDGLIRLSVGIEDVDDLIADLEQALAEA